MSAALALAVEEVPDNSPPKIDRYGIMSVPPVSINPFTANAGAFAVTDANLGGITYNTITNNTITSATSTVELVNNGATEITINVNGRVHPVRIQPGQRVVMDTAGTYANLGAYNWGTTGTTTGDLAYSSPYTESKRSRFLREIRAKMAPTILGRQKTLRRVVPGPELKARQTLRELILESEWRRYLTNGFIMTRGQSGKWYQIFNDMRRIQVYENNRLISRLCVHTIQDCPPTDHVINMKLLAELDEATLWSSSNVHSIVPGTEYGQNNPNRRNPTPPQQGNIVFADQGQLVLTGNLTVTEGTFYRIDAGGVFAGAA